ncbi:hypothetical protein H5410_037345 [Solanum commersonii]|uniref:Uncharacterized protein n=1 Tax=Solanum commersonii TaxID=4109 RepID=A0A9J5Y6V4_SOLCO|nr:hypothetical protein H5410_037345 [Solanum commersonii]
MSPTKSYEVPPRIESNEGLTSQEPSAIEASEDDVKVISKDVSLGREWVMKVNVGIDIVEIFSQCLGKTVNVEVQNAHVVANDIGVKLGYWKERSTTFYIIVNQEAQEVGADIHGN